MVTVKDILIKERKLLLPPNMDISKIPQERFRGFKLLKDENGNVITFTKFNTTLKDKKGVIDHEITYNGGRFKGLNFIFKNLLDYIDLGYELYCIVWSFNTNSISSIKKYASIYKKGYVFTYINPNIEEDYNKRLVNEFALVEYFGDIIFNGLYLSIDFKSYPDMDIVKYYSNLYSCKYVAVYSDYKITENSYEYVLFKNFRKKDIKKYYELTKKIINK